MGGAVSANAAPKRIGDRRGSITVPRLKRANTNDKTALFGVAIDFSGTAEKRKVPPGCQKCTCAGAVDCAAIPEHPNLYLHEFFQEEIKAMRTRYVPNQKRTAAKALGGAKFMQGEWFHAESAAEAPECVRTQKPKYPDGEWVEPWHVSAWVHFEDPYTHRKNRFRLWRRVERTDQKPKPESPAVDDVGPNERNE